MSSKDQDGCIVPEVGDYLYATCSAQDLGRVVAVGKDANGVDTIDIEIGLSGLNDILHWQQKDDPAHTGFGTNPLTRVEGPADLRLTIRGLQWHSMSAHSIEVGTPDGGCFRCSQCFMLHTHSERMDPAQRDLIDRMTQGHTVLVGSLKVDTSEAKVNGQREVTGLSWTVATQAPGVIESVVVDNVINIGVPRYTQADVDRIAAKIESVLKSEIDAARDAEASRLKALATEIEDEAP